MILEVLIGAGYYYNLRGMGSFFAEDVPCQVKFGYYGVGTWNSGSVIDKYATKTSIGSMGVNSPLVRHRR